MELDWRAAAVAAGVFALSLLLTGAVRGWLVRRAVLDHPVARSSHSAAVPRGGGIAVMAALGAGWLALAALGPAPHGVFALLAAALFLALLSWRDDTGGLPVVSRLIVHAAMVAFGITFVPTNVFQGLLPPLADRAAAWLLWLWFVELYNFMDGIDGIAGIETSCLGVGIAAVLALGGAGRIGIAPLALAAAAAALGFLRWNWHPARIFLGDVGSVPLGFLVGWLLLLLAARGLWAPALILPLYYLADATLTLLGRAARREAVWRAHRQHFYQRALGRGGDHAAVARMILAANGALVLLALLGVAHPVAALALALAAVALLLMLLQHRAGHGG